MTTEQIYLIIKLINAKIAYIEARNSSDGGFTERIRAEEIVDELLATALDK
jgi:hypothetical protein